MARPPIAFPRSHCSQYVVADNLISLSTDRLAKLAELRATLLKASISLRDIALATTSAHLQRIMDGRGKTPEHLLATLGDLDKNATPEERPFIEEIKAAVGAIADQVGKFNAKFVAGRTGSLTSAQQFEAHQMILREIVPVRDRVENAFGKFTEFAAGRQLEIKRDLETITARFSTQQRVGDFGLFLCVLIGAFVVGTLLRRGTRTLNGGLTEVRQSRSRLTQTSGELQKTANDLEVCAVESSSSLHETSTTVANIKSLAETSAEASTSSRSVAEVSRRLAEEGRDSVRTMADALREIADSTGQGIARIEQGGRDIAQIVRIIGEIGAKTKIINDIVFQTKLLSFNASVEAARAGEHGKGFAVVAEEVGKLAEMSGAASKEISSLLESSTKEVERLVSQANQQAVEMASASRSSIGRGRTVVEQCGKVLEAVVQNVSRAATLASQIAEATERQAQDISAIDTALGRLTDVTQRNSTLAAATLTAASAVESERTNLDRAVTHLAVEVQGSAAAQKADEAVEMRKAA